MTDQRELDRLLDAYFVEGTDELADRVIDAALDQIDHTQQRRAVRMPRRFSTMKLSTLGVAAAVIGVLAIGGALYLIQPDQPAVGGPSPTPGVSSSPSQPASPSAAPSLAVVQPREPSWIATGAMSEARFYHTATLLPDGRVLVAGSKGNTRAVRAKASAELYDPSSGTWTATGNMDAARDGHTATLLPDGRVLVAGDIFGGTAPSAELYDPGSGTWTATGDMVVGGTHRTATLLPDGRVLVAGSSAFMTDSTDGTDGWASAELYDPGSGTWTTTGKLVTPRTYQTATLLPDGRVLVAGSYDTNGDALASAELYDPISGSWTATGNMVAARNGDYTATLLPDGRVLVAGGFSIKPEPLASAELYDPISGSWTATGTMVAIRDGHTATLLPDGKVLVAGGLVGNGGPVASAELYDQGSGTWTAAGNMDEARAGHTATLLPDGRVLMAGGEGSGSNMASAELYDSGSGN